MEDGFTFKLTLDKSTDVRSGLDPRDYKYLAEVPDPGFSPEKNRQIVQETIDETTQFHNNYIQAVSEGAKERYDILSSYAVYTLSKGKSKSLRDYLGKEQFEALIGEKILAKLRVAETTNRLAGNTRFKKGILL